MIYISSSCSKKRDIRESIKELVDNGFNNIELSGGTEYFDSLKEDIIELQHKYHLNFLLHNYFPPPLKHFVLNLASVNEEIRRMSIMHIKKSINWSESFNSYKYGFHAGFFIDPNINELGKSIKEKQILDTKKGVDIFKESYLQLEGLKSNVQIYVENNVLSMKNYHEFKGNPFMLTNFGDYKKLKDKIPFNLLLDVAHLKVSCKSLGLNFHEQFQSLSLESDYLHISDNDGLNDSNFGIVENSEMFELLRNCDLKNKTVTIEVYSGFKEVRESFELLNPLVG